MNALEQLVRRVVLETLRPVLNRALAASARGTISAIDDDKTLQALQFEGLADEVHDDVEHWHHYGLTAHPVRGAEALMLGIGGSRSHGVVIGVADRRYRMTGLAEGEVAIHDDQGQSVHLTRDGIVIHTSKDIEISAEGDLTLSAEGKIALNSNEIEIGNGASLFAARKTDAASGGTITGGSTKVKIA